MSDSTGKRRASLDRLLVFANQVRNAGGGESLESLKPGVPNNAKQCLIARNLNFNCSVYIHDQHPHTGADRWVMWAKQDVVEKIAAALKLPTVTAGKKYGVRLPAEIGNVARDFDHWKDAIADPYAPPEQLVVSTGASKAAKKNLKDFWPYIKRSERKPFEKAAFLNDKGEVVAR